MLIYLIFCIWWTHRQLFKDRDDFGKWFEVDGKGNIRCILEEENPNESFTLRELYNYEKHMARCNKKDLEY